MHIINFPDHGLTITLINPVIQVNQPALELQNRANHFPLFKKISMVVFVNLTFPVTNEESTIYVQVKSIISSESSVLLNYMVNYVGITPKLCWITTI